MCKWRKKSCTSRINNFCHRNYRSVWRNEWAKNNIEMVGIRNVVCSEFASKFIPIAVGEHRASRKSMETLIETKKLWKYYGTSINVFRGPLLLTMDTLGLSNLASLKVINWNLTLVNFLHFFLKPKFYHKPPWK